MAEKTKTEVYEDRNTAVFGFLRALQELGYDVYYRRTDDPQWPAIAARLGYGEVGWHVRNDKLRPHKGWLREDFNEYQHYTREEKNARVLEFAENGPEEDFDPRVVA